MSEEFVAKAHIDALITAAIRWAGTHEPFSYYWPPEGGGPSIHVVSAETASTTGTMLWRASWAATMEWWADQEDCPFPELPEYTFEELPGQPNPLVVLNAISFYSYQTANDDPVDWRMTEQYAFLDWLQTTAVRRLPGIDDIPWGIGDDDRDVFERYPPESLGASAIGENS
jgi:hypothetical protein